MHAAQKRRFTCYQKMFEYRTLWRLEKALSNIHTCSKEKVHLLPENAGIPNPMET